MSDDRKPNDDQSLEWQELKAFILDQVRRVGRRVDVENVKKHVKEQGGDIDRVLDKLADKGYLGGAIQPSGGPPFPGPPNRPTGPPAPAGRRGRSRDHRRSMRPFESFRSYADSVEGRADKALKGFRAHFSVFASVNAFLFMVWLLTGAGFPWFLFPVFAWGIGLANHLSAAVQRLKQRREVRALPELTDEQTKSLKRRHRKRAGFAAHFITTASIAALLFMTNAITGGGFPWALIPTGALGVSLFLHWTSYAPAARRSKAELQRWLADGPSAGAMPRPDSGDDPEDGWENDLPVVREAAAVRRNIIKQIDSMQKDHSPIGEDMRPLLDNYMAQIRQLARRELDINDLVASIPLDELERDRDALQRRFTEATSESLQEEYRKTIAAVEKQITSIQDLEHSREVIALRIRSALNLLKQLQIDLARVKGLSATELSSYDLLREKSEELSTYLSDLNEGYSQLED